MSTATMSPFGAKATNKEGGDFELPPSGLHPAVLVALIDLGTHSHTYNGKTEEKRKIFLVWELTAEHQKSGETFMVAQDYTWSLNVKANFRKMLEAWSGRSFSEDEEFDPIKLIGRPCVVSLSEGKTAGGKKFVEVVGVAQPMRGQAVPPLTVEQFAWHLSQISDQKMEIPIPEWVPRNYGRPVTDDIKASKEFKALPLISGNTAPISSPPVTNPAQVEPPLIPAVGDKEPPPF